jgi:hypothetical protein
MPTGFAVFFAPRPGETGPDVYAGQLPTRIEDDAPVPVGEWIARNTTVFKEREHAWIRARSCGRRVFPVELSGEGIVEGGTILLYHGLFVKAPVCNALEILVRV